MNSFPCTVINDFGSWCENEMQTAYISGIVRQTGEEICAYNNKPGPKTGVLSWCATEQRAG